MGWESFVQRGRYDEAFVSWLITQNWGGQVEVSTWEEDVHAHVDIWWISPKGERIGIDVKGLKKRARSDASVDDSITWLEFRNVLGNEGSLYGASDYIAFRRLHCVLFVSRPKLVSYAEAKVAGKSVSQVRPNVCWALYNRRGRSDIICMAPLDELQSIADAVLPIPNTIPSNIAAGL